MCSEKKKNYLYTSAPQLSSLPFLPPPLSNAFPPSSFSRDEATLSATSFYLREEKDDNKVILEDKDLEVIGVPLIKYGDSTVIMQHVETGLWLSYKVGIGGYLLRLG